MSINSRVCGGQSWLFNNFNNGFRAILCACAFGLVPMTISAATLTVNSLADDTTASDGLVTLREAINAARDDTTTDLGETGSGADLIIFDASLANGSVALGSILPTITGDLTIDGQANNITLDAAAITSEFNKRIFFVNDASGNFTLTNLSLANALAQGGRGGSGGGGGGGAAGLGGAFFLNDGNVFIEDVSFSGNRARGGSNAGGGNSGGGGGGGVNGNGGNSPNAIEGSGGNGNPFGGGGGRGGNNNNGSTATGGGFGGAGGGGAQSAANQNAQNGGPGGYGGGGGGGGNNGSGAQGGGTIDGGVRLGGDGRRGAGGGGAGLGGAIFARNGLLQLQGVSFVNNNSEIASGSGNPKRKGGGIFIHPDATVEGTNLTFSGNQAANGTGTGYTPGVLSDTADVYGVIDVFAPDAVLTVVGANPANTESVEYQIQFSETVTGVDASDFAIAVVSGAITPIMAAPTGSGSTYSIMVDTSGPANEGEFRLNLVDDDSIVGDVSGRALNGTGASVVEGELAGVFKSMPQVTAISFPGENPSADEEVAFNVVFNRPVLGVTTAAFTVTPSQPGAVVDRVTDNGDMQTVFVTGYATTVNGSLGISLNDATGITDLAGNPLDSSNLPFSDETVLLQPASLSGFVYTDVNLNQVRDVGEGGFESLTIQLTGVDDRGPVNRTAETNFDNPFGQYVFDFLRPGTYIITQIDDPSGSTVQEWFNQIGSLGGTNSGTIGDDVISDVPVVLGDQGEEYNFGVLRTSGSIRGFVYDDVNGDGVRQTSPIREAGIGGVMLQLDGTDFEGNTVGPIMRTTFFDNSDPSSNGFYSFNSLPPGTYQITETQPANINDGLESIGTAGGTNTTNDVIEDINLGSGTSASNYNFGEQAASIAGVSWFDLNQDGQRDLDEPTLRTNVRLYDAANNLLEFQTSGFTTGEYRFSGLVPGDYTVEFMSRTAGFGFSPQDVGDDSTDSDVDLSTASGDPITGRTPAITLTVAQRTLNVDAGLISMCPPDEILFVNELAVGANNGSTWGNAFTDLQDALALVAGGTCNSPAITEVWVAQGSYVPSVPASRLATFDLPNVAVYGGFIGSETERSQRDWSQNTTILSGDLGTLLDSSDNAYHVVSVNSGSTGILDGFTIADGFANGTMPENIGAGIFVNDGAPILQNLIVRANQSADGGAGLAVGLSSAPMVVNAQFNGNIAGSDGGAILATNTSSSMLINLTITGNDSSGSGGGLAVDATATVDMASSIIWGNTATGAVAILDTGMVLADYSLVEGGFAAGTNILNVDPAFIDADGADDLFGTADDNPRLQISSPAIDAGDSTRVPADVQVDLDGLDRIANILEVPDTGVGSSPVVDMGAFEVQRGSAELLFVDPDASAGNGSGLSWSNAFLSVRDALLAAIPGDEIWVANGAYLPSASNDVNESFQLITGVGVYGGFEGLSGAQETSRDQRNTDPRTNGTLLSGNLGLQNIETDNSYHVVDGSGTDASAVLDGFSIGLGNAQGAQNPDRFGGGLIIEQGSPTLRNVLISSNLSSSNGGGAYLSRSSATFENCIFELNFSASSGGGIWRSADRSSFTNCQFISNQSNSVGGGIYSTTSFFDGMSQNSASDFVDTVISGNRAGSDGGGLYFSSATDTFTNLLLTGNTAGDQGGGAFVAGSTGIMEATHCVISQNKAVTQGQAVYLNSGTTTLRNCIVEDHPNGTALELRSTNETLTLAETLFNGNSLNFNTGIGTVNESGTVPADPPAAFVGGPSGQLDGLFGSTISNGAGVALLNATGANLPTDGSLIGKFIRADATQSLHYRITGNTDDTITISLRSDNLSGIGQMANYEIVDYHLTDLSPAIDAGLDFTAQAPASVFDLDGNPRPGGSGFDLGAFEFTDQMPNQFIFIDVTDVALGALQSSNTVTISGINTATPISVTGGLYAINGGGFVDTPGMVSNGDMVQVQHTSAATFLTAVDTVLDVGGVTDTFTSTTLAQDIVPDQFMFIDQTDVPLSATVTSAAITVTGINDATAISVTNGLYSVNGGPFIAAGGNVVNGDDVQVQHTSSAAFVADIDTVLDIGGVTDTFTSTTEAQDIQPDQFMFVDQIDVPLSATVTSAPITVMGINDATPISVTNGLYSINGGPFTAAAGTVNNGDSVAVQHTAAATILTNVNTLLNINGVTDSFTTTTTGDGPNLSVTKDDFRATADTGQPIEYTIVVSNIGTENVLGATVTDILPGDLSSAMWTCTASAGGVCAATGSGNITDTVDVPVGGTLTYILSATVSINASMPITNTVTVDFPGDVDQSDNTASDVSRPTLFADGFEGMEFLLLTLQENQANVVVERQRNAAGEWACLVQARLRNGVIETRTLYRSGDGEWQYGSWEQRIGSCQQ